jgi:hypothetical protein
MIGHANNERHGHLLLWLALLPALFWGSPAVAQELAPRAYWPAPEGTKILVLGYQYSTGDIVTDPSLPVTGVDSKVNHALLGFVYNFDLVGRTANVQVNLPYSWGESEGFAEGEFRRRVISGLTDLRARLSVNLLGAPTMDVAEFQDLRANPRPIIGASFQVQMPTGDYDADKLLNAGTNRWAVKPAVGVILPIRPTWLLEFEVGGWFIGTNDDFLGMTREQAPIISTELHLVKRLRPGFWLSVDANYYAGGRSTVDGTPRGDLQRNSRVGATILYPFRGGHAVRGSLSAGVVTGSGGDFNIFAFNYLYVWR